MAAAATAEIARPAAPPATEAADEDDAGRAAVKKILDNLEHEAKHNELQCLDALMEEGCIQRFLPFVDHTNFVRVARYIVAVEALLPKEADKVPLAEFSFQAALKVNALATALGIGLRSKGVLRDARISIVLKAAADRVQRKQLYLLLSAARWEPPSKRGTDGTQMRDEDAKTSAGGAAGGTAAMTDGGAPGPVSDKVAPDDEEEVSSILSNAWLPGVFHSLAKELDVLAPKSPEDVNKRGYYHGAGGGGGHHYEDPATWVNHDVLQLCQSVVNGFVNAGFGTDALMQPAGTPVGDWLFSRYGNARNSSALTDAATLGCINLWNVDQGLDAIDKLRWTQTPGIRAGALIAFGLCCSWAQQHPCDPAYSLLVDELEQAAENSAEKRAAIFGLAVSQAGTRRHDLLEILVPYVVDVCADLTVSALAGLAIGLCFVGTADEAAAECLLECVLERQSSMDHQFDQPLAYLFAVALGLVFLGTRDAADATLEALGFARTSAVGSYTCVVVSSFAWAASGDVEKVEYFLKQVLEQSAPAPPAAGEDASAAAAVPPAPAEPAAVSAIPAPSDGRSGSALDGGGAVGITNPSATNGESSSVEEAATGGPRMGDGSEGGKETFFSDATIGACVLSASTVAAGERIGTAMQPRLFDRVLQFGCPAARCAVPLGLALLNPSSPQPVIVDRLSKLSHEADLTMSVRALFSLGVVGAGTNNARIADELRNARISPGRNASTDSGGVEIRDGSSARYFATQAALGLLFMSKGLVTLNPFVFDGSLASPVTLGCLLVLLHGCLFGVDLFRSEHSFLLLLLMVAIRPRFFVAVDENMRQVPVTVRVGTATDMAGQAGQHTRTVSGFQTHTAPVLLAAGERAELASDDWEPVLPDVVLEGVVIFKPKLEEA